jgi:hypothetical protein
MAVVAFTNQDAKIICFSANTYPYPELVEGYIATVSAFRRFDRLNDRNFDSS